MTTDNKFLRFVKDEIFYIDRINRYYTHKDNVRTEQRVSTLLQLSDEYLKNGKIEAAYRIREDATGPYRESGWTAQELDATYSNMVESHKAKAKTASAGEAIVRDIHLCEATIEYIKKIKYISQ